jgi:hypothetical protein
VRLVTGTFLRPVNFANLTQSTLNKKDLFMADDVNLRVRRHNLHRHDDHHLCRAENCAAAAADANPPVPSFAEPGSAESAMREYAKRLKLKAGDVRMPLIEACIILARMLDKGENIPTVVREYRRYLGWIAEFGREAEKIDEIRSKHALRRAADAAAQVAGRQERPLSTG